MIECVADRPAGLVLVVGAAVSLLGVLVRNIYRYCTGEEMNNMNENAPGRVDFEKAGNLRKERRYSHNLGVYGSGSPESAGTLYCPFAADTRK